ncbi:MAG: hypothetical protein ACE5G3_08000 [Gammaproteobacteria bacterium]
MSRRIVRPLAKVLSTIELTGPEAAWVLGAHLYATLVPLVLVLAATHHREYLLATTSEPFLFHAAAVMLAAGSAFEVAQNALDKWYLTPESASANGVGFCDMLFYWFVTAGQAVLALAIAGGAWWVTAIAWATVVAFPVCYLTGTAHFAPMGVAGLLVAVTGYLAFRDPVIFLSVFLAGVTMYFYGALLKTGAQILHGLTTAAASSGIWFFVWAVHNGAEGTQHSWQFAAGIMIVTVIAMALGWPVIARLPPSERIIRPAS